MVLKLAGGLLGWASRGAWMLWMATIGVASRLVENTLNYSKEAFKLSRPPQATEDWKVSAKIRGSYASTSYPKK